MWFYFIFTSYKVNSLINEFLIFFVVILLFNLIRIMILINYLKNFRFFLIVNFLEAPMNFLCKLICTTVKSEHVVMKLNQHWRGKNKRIYVRIIFSSLIKVKNTFNTKSRNKSFFSKMIIITIITTYILKTKK